MKRSWAVLGILLLGLVAGTALSGAAASAATPSSTLASATVVTGVQDFEFESFEADYYLARDDEGHATVHVVETFVARFPSFNQNRGMIRAIPNDYDGVPLHTEVESVVDEHGLPVPYDLTVRDGFTELALGTDDFVHGRTTYVISYRQQNVVRAFADTEADEFYRDTNGTGFAQPFGLVSARVHIDPELTEYLTGAASCYQGVQGSTATCEVERLSTPEGEVFQTTVRGLAAFENVSVAIALAPGTFVQVPADPRPTPVRPMTPWWADAGAIGISLLAVLGTVVAGVLRFRRPREAKGRGIIIPQYTVPNDLNLLESGVIVQRDYRSVAAQIVSLAVRGKVRILDYAVSSSGADYSVQLLDASGLDELETALVNALFSTSPLSRSQRESVVQSLRGVSFVSETVVGAVATALDSSASAAEGAVCELGVTNSAVASAIASVRGAAHNRVRERGFTLKRSLIPGVLVAVGMFVLSFVSIGVVVLAGFFGGFSVWAVPSILLSFLAIFVCAFFAWRPVGLTAAGAEHRDYLLGLRDYLTLAEEDRFRMLQSPEGAERVRAEGLDPARPAQRVKLYEKLLPFAVLWGVEREWAKELTVFYGDSAPDWFVTTGSFDAARFSSSLGSFASTTVAHSPSTSSGGSSWSGSSGGSFSGGSSGGGFSGGGGGGGGGGGR